MTIKGQVLVNYVIEFIGFPEEIRYAPIEKKTLPGLCRWLVLPVGRGVWVHIVTDSGEKHHYAIKLAFKTTNNEAKYEAMLVGLTIIETLGAIEVGVRVDSQVVMNQVRGEFTMKSEKLKKSLQSVWEKCNHFQCFCFQ